MYTLKELEKEFDEKFSDEDFCCCAREYCYPTDNANYEPIIKIKSFISTSLRELLEQVVPEGKGHREGDSNWPHDEDLSFLNYTPCCIWNKCRSEVEERIKEILGN